MSGPANDPSRMAPYVREIVRSPKDLQLTMVKWATLDMLRCLFVGLAEDNSHGFSAAMARGDWYFENGVSADMTAALLDYVHQVRRRRRTKFVFSDPRCPCCRPRVTDCEYRMLSIIDARLDGRAVDAKTHAIILCEGPADEELLRAAAAVGRVMERAVMRGGTQRAH